jgi:hypothetical protein
MLNHKRILSLILAGAMSAALAVPAFADGETEATETKEANTATNITATYQAVTIAVVVPETGETIINPYALPVVIGQDGSDKDIEVSEQIITKPLALKNQSKVKLNVSATVTTTLNEKTDMTLASTALTSEDTAKKAFVFLDVVQDKTLTGEADSVTDGKVNAAFKAATWTDPTKYSETTTGAIALNATKAVTKSNMAVLAASTYSDGAFSKYTEGSIAFFRLNGNCVASPSKSAWTADDGFTAKIAFTFTPNTDA